VAIIAKISSTQRANPPGECRERDAVLIDMPSRLLPQSGIATVHADPTVFEQPWWIEIAKGDSDYRELQVSRAGVAVGRLGFILVTNKLGNKLGFPPIWSHLGGPVVSQDLGREERTDVIRELIAQLPRNTSFRFVCSPTTSDADLTKLEFTKAGFEWSTETTYLQYPSDDGILERLFGESRRQVVSAPKKLQVLDIGADEFVAFYEVNLRESGKKSYASLQSVRDLIIRGQRGDAPQIRIIAAKQRREGAPLDAAIAYAWDNKRFYLWLVTHRHSSDNFRDKPHPHAVKLLIFVGTEVARKMGLIFDADGAITEGNQILYRDRLKFPHAEFRNVFTRDTKMYGLYKRFQMKFRGLSGSRRSF
jgi:hypothetical protein